MFWIGFLIGILVLPALWGFTALILFLISAIPYFIGTIKDYFASKKTKKEQEKASAVETVVEVKKDEKGE